jgi:hypothetical protein
LRALAKVVQQGKAVGETQIDIRGGSATVVLAEGGEEPLRVTITPRERRLHSVRVDVRCEGELVSSGRESGVWKRRVARGGSYTLGWGDVLRISGLEGPHGQVLLDLIVRP